MRKSYLLTVAVLLVTSAFVVATEIPLVNPSFEEPGLIKIKSWNADGDVAIDIPGWASDTPCADSGVEQGWTPTDGEWTAFAMSGDPSFWQLSDFTITGGEIVTLTIDARNTWASKTIKMSLYADDAGVRTVLATQDCNVVDTYTTFTLACNTGDNSAAIGKKLGVEFSNSSTGSTWAGFDNVKLSYELTLMAPPAGSLTHSYTFEDGTARDVVGDANGTLVGGAKIENGALVTTAQDQWMEMPGDKIAINTYSEVTIEAWYTPVNGGNTSWTMLAYFGASDTGAGNDGFFITTARGDNVSRAAISCGNVSAPYSVESGANGTEYDDGKLHHMVATIDATTISLYIDGALASKTALSAANKISALSNKLAYLAKGGYTGDPEWLGAIQEFRIYNKALTPGEALYLAALTVKDPGTDNLTHQYTFDDGTTNDSVGGVNGTLVGGATVADGALLTTAQDQWMEMSGADLAINTYEAFSVAAWFTPTAGANTGYHMICYFGDSLNGYGSNGIFYTPARGDNVSRAGISCGNTSAPWGAETGVNGPEIDDGQPHFVVATIDGTNVTLYQDGVLYGPATLSAANKLSAVSTNFAYLAKGGYTGDPEWLGQIHEFRIYNKALTVGEADFLFSQGQ
jgi:hypothetical protein